MEKIHLRKDEYEELPEGVAILVSTILQKLPGPQRKKYAALEWQRLANQKEAELIQAGIEGQLLSAWLNTALTPAGKSFQAIAKILINLEILKATYGPDAINAALVKITAYGAPQKCTIPYLKAVLKADAANAPDRPKSDAEKPGAAPTDPAAIWAALVARLEQRINAPSFRTWLAPLQLVGVEANALRLLAPDTNVQQWDQKYYAWMIQEEAHTLFGRPMTIAIAAAAAEEET